MTTRRQMMTTSAQVAALMAGAGLLPTAAHAAWPQAAFEAKNMAEAAKAFGGGAPVESKDVTITGPDAATWNEQIQAKVRTEACRMGGEIVTLNAASAQAVAAASMTQFMVLVRPPPTAPPAPATP